jgi:hypothetical protein
VIDRNVVDWLIQEISDLLDAGSVGLYEFVDELNDPERELSSDERKDVARQALDRLIEHGDVEIQRRRWAGAENEGTVSARDLPTDPWAPPDEQGRYLAITRRAARA